VGESEREKGRKREREREKVGWLVEDGNTRRRRWKW
jgi:hypothetical protein